MTADTTWPHDLLAPRIVTAELVPASVSGDRILTAIEQLIDGDKYWQIILDQIPFASPGQKRAWRAISAQLEGRSGTINIPIYDDCAPWPIVNGIPQRRGPGAPHSDATPFDDDSLYDQETITASMLGAIAALATACTIRVTLGDALEAGQHFTPIVDDDRRLYRIASITSTTVNATSIDYGVTFVPPARAAVADGTILDFANPHCTCRAATDTEMMTGADDYAGRTTARTAWVEASVE